MTDSLYISVYFDEAIIVYFFSVIEQIQQLRGDLNYIVVSTYLTVTINCADFNLVNLKPIDLACINFSVIKIMTFNDIHCNNHYFN